MTRPNVLLIVADQMRLPGADGTMPPELAAILGFEDGAEGSPYARFFPGMLALRRHAVVLRQHCVASSACTPSRGVLFTGHFGARTGLTQTSGMAKQGHERGFPWLDPAGVPTLGDWFRAAGYDAHWFGKWHLSEPRGGDLAPWGFADGERSAPEPHGANPRNLGVYRDRGFADDAVRFLRAARRDRPWLAVASLVNPHDISGFPVPWWPGVDPTAFRWPPALPSPATRSLPFARGRSIALNPGAFPEDCFEPPATLDEPLAAAGKPRCHAESAYKVGLALRARWPLAVRGLCPLPFQLTRAARAWFRAYGRHYAYLHHLVDREIARLLDTLREQRLKDRTIVVFTSDHGELAGAHGGMIHKWHTAYEQVLRVPCVVSSPLVNADATSMRSVDQPTSHADLLPTLLSLAGASTVAERAVLADRIEGQRVTPLVGADLGDVIAGRGGPIVEPDGEARQGVFFTTDDEITARVAGEAPRRWHRAFEREIDRAIDAGVPLARGPVAAPAHVQCVRTPRWKYVRCWDPAATAQDEWELYFLARDPEERHNLVGWNHGAAVVRPDRIPSAWAMAPEQVEAERVALQGVLERSVTRYG